MAMGGDGEEEAQEELWIEAQSLVRSPGRPFYNRLNKLLAKHGFNLFVRGLCEKYYKEGGRPSIPPETYFRILFIGYFEGLESERRIAWTVADSMALRKFLGYELNEDTPDHSSLSRIRHRISLETHKEVFAWVLSILGKDSIIKGKTMGIDATTLPANAAMRSIVRHDTGERYDEFLKGLAKESGIETPTREDLTRIDRERPKKGSNDDWFHPHDPDAGITKMKDGSTHIAHKAEHAVDMESGAVVAVTLHAGPTGDTKSVMDTYFEALDNLHAVAQDPEAAANLHPRWGDEVTADKGYHSNEILNDFSGLKVRTYISEPKRGKRHWKDKEKAREAVYANRRRIRGNRGVELLRRRGEKVERTFAHCYETGGMRQLYLRGRENILKRLLLHVCAFNLGLLMRKLYGCGTPRELANAFLAVFALLRLKKAPMAAFSASQRVQQEKYLGITQFKAAG